MITDRPKLTTKIALYGTVSIFRLTLRQSQSNKAGLKCPSVCTYMRTYVRPSTKGLVDFNEIWHVGRGR